MVKVPHKNSDLGDGLFKIEDGALNDPTIWD